MALSEFPFFVLDVSDIEVVHFERMFYGIKNFDLAVIKKDFTTCLRINSIPTEYTEELKSYFNEIGIIYLESMAPLKWDLILNNIREDFKGWLEEGGWMQLVDVSKNEVVTDFACFSARMKKTAIKRSQRMKPILFASTDLKKMMSLRATTLRKATRRVAMWRVIAGYQNPVKTGTSSISKRWKKTARQAWCARQSERALEFQHKVRAGRKPQGVAEHPIKMVAKSKRQ